MVSLPDSCPAWHQALGTRKEKGWKEAADKPGLPDNFPAPVLRGSQQKRVDSLIVRAGGLGTACRGRWYLGTVWGHQPAVGMEKETNTNMKVLSEHRVVRLGCALDLWPQLLSESLLPNQTQGIPIVWGQLSIHWKTG